MLRSTHPPSPTNGSGSSVAPAFGFDAKMVSGGARDGAVGSAAPSRAKLLQILNVWVVGSGERMVVLSHGFETDQSAWSRVLPCLTRDYRVCADSVNSEHFDFRRYDTLDSYVNDLLAILDALCIPRWASTWSPSSTRSASRVAPASRYLEASPRSERTKTQMVFFFLRHPVNGSLPLTFHLTVKVFFAVMA